jgi:serine/threonine protein kinase
MQHFKPIKIIGKGSFGEVTKAVDLRTNKIRAIKKIKKSAIQKEKGMDKDKEYEILTKLVSIKLFYIVPIRVVLLLTPTLCRNIRTL